MAPFTTTVDRPRAVVFAVLPSGHAADEQNENWLAEIKELLRSAEVDCVGEVVQRRERPNPKSYLGPGKLRELRQTVQQLGATVAVCEDNLTPAQVAAILDVVDADVLDRTELILSVFAKHAHSLAGTLQVHLAQLEYELTRVRGKGLVLSRLGAGVDMRGPGETKLEVERRVLRERIRTLRRRIERMASTRRTQRVRRLRSDIPLIALAGYTNAGKSTLLNALTDAGVPVADRLFETLDPTTRALRYRDRDYVITDTVGFIRKLPHELVDAFASTLEETSVADLILVVADASLSFAEIAARQQTVSEVLDMIGSGEIPRLIVFNKADLASAEQLRRLRDLYPESVTVSALTGAGLEGLLERITTFFASKLVPVRLLVPYAEGALVHRLRGIATDITQEATADGLLVTARVPTAEAARLAAYRVPSQTEPAKLAETAPTATVRQRKT